MRNNALLLAAALLLASCAGPPSRQQMEAADYGPYPTTYEQIVKDYMKDLLFDPYTAVYEFRGPPVKSYRTLQGFTEHEYVYCYQLFVSINAKNRMGGYTGMKTHTFWIRDGRVLYQYEGCPNGVCQ